jgi:hypothetical protein
LLLTVDGVGKAGKREALRALVSELVRQNKALSTEREHERTLSALKMADLTEELAQARREAADWRDRHHNLNAPLMGWDAAKSSKMLLPWESVVGDTGDAR